MEFNKIYALIIFAIMGLLNEVQCKAVLNKRQFLRNIGKTARFGIAGLSARSLKLGAIENTLIGPTIFDNDIKTQRILKYFNTYLPAPIVTDTMEDDKSVGNMFKNLNSNQNITTVSQQELHKQLYTTETDFKDKENILRYYNSNTNINKSSNSPRVQCRQRLDSLVNNEDNTIDNVRHICNPSPAATTLLHSAQIFSYSPLPYALKEKRFGHLTSSTSSGINCRRVMNSELNEQGEIIDSVRMVCDPPTTTTTTTKKPTLSTTPITTTTTAKPLVKICRPVMNSYLNEVGEIIDSVKIVCKMETIA